MKNILMNTAMTKSILDGSKVQFRRVIDEPFAYTENEIYIDNMLTDTDGFISLIAEYHTGDTLKVVEEYKDINEAIVHIDEVVEKCNHNCKIEHLKLKEWLDELIMLRHKQIDNIFLKVTNVRVERLQDISDEDILSEGILNSNGNHSAFTEEDNRINFLDLWNSTAPKGYKWEDNPYIFVYKFERIQQ